MKLEKIVCQNCKNEFKIEEEDFDFYKKIQVPPPTWCPECRLIRRMIWRNERTLYKRKCDFSGKEIFSMFSKDAQVKVYDREVWWSDQWDPLEYGMEYDFSKPFFDQFFQLIKNVPWFSRVAGDFTNSDYCMNAAHLKNCYLIFYSNYDENCFFGNGLHRCRDCYDNSYLVDCELCYGSFRLKRCNRAFFCAECEDCLDIYFCKNCTGCSNCFGCANLKHKSYCIFNKQYSKEEYFEKIKTLDYGSFKNLVEIQMKAEDFWKNFPQKFIHGRHNENVSGDYIYNSKNVINSYFIEGGEDLKYCTFMLNSPIRDCYDYTIFGNNAELIYESLVVGEGASMLKSCLICWPNCKNLEYCIMCASSSNLFGCIGLRHKQYCILNKQYTKEEYERLVPKIIEHMNKMPYIDKKGRVYKYGEFFPPELSPFAYNETIAQEYFPLTKEKALEKGYKWKDEEQRYYKPDLKTEDLPDHIKDVKDDILGKIIQCAHAKLNKDGILQATCNENCTTAFKIIEPELQFYRKMNLPLPRLCPNCRHFQRIKQRNPLKLWKRKCMCQGETSTNGLYKN
ncbi:MAG: hypothetical protein QW156_04170, partial [Candidatus Aenigmatarchaeota archaeon]